MLCLCLSFSPALAVVEHFPLEENLCKMYCEVDLDDMDDASMLVFAYLYTQWVDEQSGKLESKEDCIYMARLSYMFGEVYISQYFGN